jgi:hypothetical protein
MPVIPAPGRQKQKDFKFEANLDYISHVDIDKLAHLILVSVPRDYKHP